MAPVDHIASASDPAVESALPVSIEPRAAHARWLRWRECDRAWAGRFNRSARFRSVYHVCRIASRLGDGVVWYVLLIVLPFVAGSAGTRCAIQLFVVGSINLTLYLVLKRALGRPRPYVTCVDIRLHGRALDRFSFPSGHSVHAAGCTVALALHFPVAGFALAPFAAVIAVSRLVLGLHYPSDVAAGLAIGSTVAFVVVRSGVVLG